MSNPKLAIVIGSVRPNRFAAHAAEWIEEMGRFRRRIGDARQSVAWCQYATKCTATINRQSKGT